MKQNSSQSTVSKNSDFLKENIESMAGRFRYARSLTGLSRSSFCRKYGISYNTLQSWEISRTTSREGGVAKFCEALAQDGIICTEAWLLEGIGPIPTRSTGHSDTIYSPPLTARVLKTKHSELRTHLALKEVLSFQQNHQAKGFDPVIIQLIDESMQPEFKKGDFIGALKLPMQEVPKHNQSTCLIETEPHHFLVRNLIIEGDKFILLAANKDFPVLAFDSLTSVSEIVLRMRLPS